MPESESIAEAERRKKKKTAAAAEAERQSLRAAARSRSHGGARRVAPATIAVEKRLSNGDLYAGGFVGNLPEGQGKYLWADGCMYEGEWRKGKACGVGNFSWPTGATYEGEFRRGRFEGIGTFTAADGGTYRGAWAHGSREGYGRKCYSNGDVYEGWWRRNLHDGDGRYMWKNGDQYAGEWNSGEISGDGALIWSTGDRYEGRWDAGIPVGSGVLLSSEGYRYAGEWRKLAGDRLHRFTASSENAVADGEFPLAGRRSEECPLPRICVWEADGGDEGCFPAAGEGEGSVESMSPAEVRRRGEQRRRTTARVSSREGEMIEVGHKSYDLMRSVQLGIRYSVGNQAGGREVCFGDFEGREGRWRRFPREGTRTTPPHQSPEFRWKDYCPMVFRRLREEFRVDPAEYMMSICGDDALRGLSSPGKSGSSFYLTHDQRFMIKTVKKSEVKVLLKMLRSYYTHVCEHNTSLLTKFFGVHCVKPVGGPKTRFVVMGNLLFSHYPIHTRFDLKGSTHGRRTDNPGPDIGPTTTLKDLDLNFAFRLHPDRFYQLKRQIDIDCGFLEAEGIMDYSLLVGLHFTEPETGDPFMSISDMNDVIRRHSSPFRVQARVERRVGKGDISAVHSGTDVRDSILHLGIIDILQGYDISKKLEHVYKSLQVDPTSISAVDPKYYSKRIRDFVGRIFMDHC